MLLPIAQGEKPKGETKYMSDFQDSANTTGTPRWVGLAVAVLGGISLLSLGVGWSALNQAKSVEQSTQASVKQANEALTQRLAKADDINQQVQSDVKVVTDKLNLTQAKQECDHCGRQEGRQPGNFRKGRTSHQGKQRRRQQAEWRRHRCKGRSGCYQEQHSNGPQRDGNAHRTEP